ncbi:lysozyme inhibitor LprI family protein [Inquilinus sp. Marseille-Q2685]|uniref:lysozyme inhibitor LprI family protein n=1 Tax=Inquilinus sp. Marseille-Q2685 TaxID=2866581 RepID=UPI001CE46042|nr:lysozyme inhibitor LprI family protein [Inquilinus sp. Marseille-Q2685]
MRRVAALLAVLLLPALPARAEQVLTLEVLSAKLAPDRTDVLLRLVDDSGIGVLRPEGQCDSSQPGIGEAASGCYAVTIAENSAPVARYSYRILETRGTDSFLLLTWPSAAAGERRVSLRVDYNGFYNHDPETVLLLSDYDNGALDPQDPFETLHRIYAGKLKAFAAELADNPPVDDAEAARWRDAFLAAQRRWTQFAESDCVVAARLSGEPARSRCLADRAMDRIDWLEGSSAPQ